MNPIQQKFFKKRNEVRDLLSLIELLYPIYLTGVLAKFCLALSIPSWIFWAIVVTLLAICVAYCAQQYIQYFTKDINNSISAVSIVGSTHRGESLKREGLMRRLYEIRKILSTQSGLDLSQLNLSVNLDKSHKKSYADNAYATATRHFWRIGISESLLSLPDPIIISVLSHEIGHLYQKDPVTIPLNTAKKIYSFTILIPIFLTGIFTLGFYGTALTILQIVLINFFVLNLSLRYREHTADLFVKTLGFSKDFIKILEEKSKKLENNFVFDFLTGVLGTHPSLRMRIKTLTQQPSI